MDDFYYDQSEIIMNSGILNDIQRGMKKITEQKNRLQSAENASNIRLDYFLVNSKRGTYSGYEKLHDAFKILMRDMLLYEGFKDDDIIMEYRLPEFNRRYIADVVGLQDKKVHTVIEVGNLNDPAKLIVMRKTYPRFIWIPYLPILDLKYLVNALDDLKALPAKIESVKKEMDQVHNNVELQLKHLLKDKGDELVKLDAAVKSRITTLNKIEDILIEMKNEVSLITRQYPKPVRIT